MDTASSPTAPAEPPAPLTLTAIPADGDSPQPLAIQPDGSGEYRFSLECLPGANAIHLLIATGGRPLLRAEVRAQGGEQVRCDLRLDATGAPCLKAGSHQVLLLALEPEYGPLPPIPPPHEDSAWDICLVIDATTRTTSAPGGPNGRDQPPNLDAFLVNQPDQWGAVIEPVLELVRQLDRPVDGPDQGCRLAIITFGDEPPPPGVYAPDLVPAFHLRSLPEGRPEHLLIPIPPEALAELLHSRLRSTPGGDFVDALADALAAAGRLQWGDERRRLLVLIGDSPGHATADPVPHGGDALPRRTDVDSEAARLHREQRVEVLTLYHPPPAALARTLLEPQQALIDFARGQYRRLASEPRLAFSTADFDPGQAVAILLGRQAPLGRGPAWGRLTA
jgi:hypothetical protein